MRCYSQLTRANDVLIEVFLVATMFVTGCSVDLTGVSSLQTGLDKISLTGPSTVPWLTPSIRRSHNAVAAAGTPLSATTACIATVPL